MDYVNRAFIRHGSLLTDADLYIYLMSEARDYYDSEDWEDQFERDMVKLYVNLT